eukprot:365028-Chlamydomonas_euryale.AAC.38
MTCCQKGSSTQRSMKQDETEHKAKHCTDDNTRVQWQTASGSWGSKAASYHGLIPCSLLRALAMCDPVDSMATSPGKDRTCQHTKGCRTASSTACERKVQDRAAAQSDSFPVFKRCAIGQ